MVSCFGIVNVNAKSLKITKKTYIKTGIGSRKEAKFYTSKGYAWCITPMKTGANQGTTLYYKNTIKDNGLVWLIENGGHSDKGYLASHGNIIISICLLFIRIILVIVQLKKLNL